MIVPPPRRTIGPAIALVRRNGPTRLTASARSRSSQSVSRSSRSGTGPSVLALLTSTSIGPTAAAACPAAGGGGRRQEQIARVAGIPRATWANLESGAANPTLAVLIKVAHALQVRLEELIEPPRRTGRLYRAAELPWREKNAVIVRKLLPE